MRRSELFTQPTQLLFINERPASRHNIVFGLEFDDGTFGACGLLTQSLKPLLQPIACTAIGLVLGVQLIENIPINQRIGDLTGLFWILRMKINSQHVALTDSSDVKSAAYCANRCSNALRF